MNRVYGYLIFDNLSIQGDYQKIIILLCRNQKKNQMDVDVPIFHFL